VQAILVRARLRLSKCVSLMFFSSYDPGCKNARVISWNIFHKKPKNGWRQAFRYNYQQRAPVVAC
jgi:hypothetical protein